MDKKLEGIISQIKNANFMFDRQRSGLLDSLDQVENQIKQDAFEAIDLAKIQYYKAVLVSDKYGNQEEVKKYLQLALAENDNNKFLSDAEELKAYEILAGACVGLGDIEEAKKWLNSIMNLTSSKEYENDVRLGANSQVAFFFHELSLFNEAFELNSKILESSKILYGNEPAKYLNMIRNLAENSYCLNKPDEAIKYLVEAADVVKVGEDYEAEVDIYFKLGVISCELGKGDIARAYMENCLKSARNSDNSELIYFAESNIVELENRLA